MLFCQISTHSLDFSSFEVITFKGEVSPTQKLSLWFKILYWTFSEQIH